MLVKPLDEFAMLFKFGNSMSPNSFTIEFVSHGDPRDGCEDGVCCGFFTALFWKTLQTTHSSWKKRRPKKSIRNCQTKKKMGGGDVMIENFCVYLPLWI